MNRMRAKNQQIPPSEADAKEKLIVYVYEYLTHCNANRAAQEFLQEIRWEKEIRINEKPGFLVNWWCVFWDLYCAAPDKRNAIESSVEAKAFMNYRDVMSPSCSNSSPPQPPFMGGPMGPGGPPIGGPRYGGPPGQIIPQHMRPIQPRMQGPPPPGSNIQPPYMMANSNRYPHPPPQPPHQSHMTPPASAGGIYPEPGPSPGVSRMTPSHSASPHHQMTPTPQMGGQPQGGVPQSSGPMMPMQGPPPGHQMQPQPGWQPNNQVNYNVNSPGPHSSGGFMMNPQVGSGGAGHGDMGSMMNDNGMMEVKNEAPNGPSTPLSAENSYIMPNYQQDTDQTDAAEIMKVKQSLQEQTKQEYSNDYYCS